MSTLKDAGFAPARYENGRAFTIAGFGERYTQQTLQNIPALWQRFASHIGKVPGQVGHDTYGLCCNPDSQGGFEYIAGVEVTSTGALTQPFCWHTLAPQHYAVFEHRGAISGIGRTFERIWKEWLPGSGEEAADAPGFERYGKDFDPDSNNSVVEIWLPLKIR
uniref:GyrI-like domain-containing protein n=1 Tax=Pseudomonas laurentiana TaxID=2364649 RepID=UPI0029C76161|nr:GyrI-like domain-containing protein [Pseudomonas laurentiana]